MSPRERRREGKREVRGRCRQRQQSRVCRYRRWRTSQFANATYGRSPPASSPPPSIPQLCLRRRRERVRERERGKREEIGGRRKEVKSTKRERERDPVR